MLKDVFGTPIQIGNVILISKGTRGHKDFEQGVIVEIIPNPKKIWIKTVRAFKKYNYQTKSYDAQYSLVTSKHLAGDGTNNHILVVTDITTRKAVPKELFETVPLLVSSGICPSNYVLGQSVKQKEKKPEDVTPVILPMVEEDLFESLGMPSILK